MEAPYRGELHFGVDVGLGAEVSPEIKDMAGKTTVSDNEQKEDPVMEEARRSGHQPDLIPNEYEEITDKPIADIHFVK